MLKWHAVAAAPLACAGLSKGVLNVLQLHATQCHHCTQFKPLECPHPHPTGAGLPKGVLNVVHGTHDTVNRILDHPDIASVSFVGSGASRFSSLLATCGQHLLATSALTTHPPTHPSSPQMRRGVTSTSAAAQRASGCRPTWVQRTTQVGAGGWCDVGASGDWVRCPVWGPMPIGYEQDTPPPTPAPCPFDPTTPCSDNARRTAGAHCGGADGGGLWGGGPALHGHFGSGVCGGHGALPGGAGGEGTRPQGELSW